MQTLKERIADSTKVNLAYEFIGRIVTLAAVNALTPDTVYAMWLKHVARNESMDQSPTMMEFIEWNKLKEVA